MKNMKCKKLMIVARYLIALLFAASLFGKLTDFSSHVSYIESSAVLFGGIAAFALVVGIILEAVGVLSLLSGKKLCLGAGALIVFTAFATLMFHLPTDELQTVQFLKNIAIIGGLLAIGLSACNCGCRDKKCCEKKTDA